MYLLGLGLIVLLMKVLEYDPVAQWSWWWVLSPFALTVIWWIWADWSGYTKRKSMEREVRRREERVERQREQLRNNVRPRR